MFNYQIIIEYDGTNFVGWQMQKNGLSIQDAIQKILTKILKQKTTLYGSGRTDSGVHAIAQSAHFITSTKINNNFFFLNTINFFLKKKKNIYFRDKTKKTKFSCTAQRKKKTVQICDY